MKKTILITGGAGYLGSSLVKNLASAGNHVIVYSRDELKHFNLKLELSNELLGHVSFVIGDVRDRERLSGAMTGVEAVIHAAAMKQVGVCEENPGECFKTNINGAEHVIAACQANNVKKLIFVSTDKAVDPISVYGNSKQAGERLVLKANSEKLQASVVRFGNLIGSPGSILDKLKKQERGRSITLYNDQLTRFVDTIEQTNELIFRQLSEDFGGTIMLPKLKAVSVQALVAHYFPEVLITFGEEKSFEKTHEKLASASELTRMIDCEGYYLITQTSLDQNQALDQFGGLPLNLESYCSQDLLVEADKVLF